jgi:hypothetical protein
MEGAWFCYACNKCGETGWFIMPLNVNFGGPLSPVLTGYCPLGHQTTIRGEDVGKTWLCEDQRTPAWYPLKQN